MAGYCQDCGRPMKADDLMEVVGRARVRATAIVMSPDRTGYSEIVNFMLSLDSGELVLYLDDPTPIGQGRR
jgi:hypothetical protein